MNISYLNFIKGFLSDKLSLRIFWLSLFILIFTYIIFFQKKSLLFFPDSDNIQVNFYNDSLDGGKSVITATNLSKESASMSFILKDGFVRPYVGISFFGKTNQEYDLSVYNMVKVDMSGNGIKPMYVYLVLKDSSANFEGNVLGLRYLCQYLEITNENTQFKLPIKKFATPDWWFDKYNLSPASISKPNWNRMFMVTVATGLTPSHNNKKSFQVNSIVFCRDNTKFIISEKVQKQSLSY